MRRLWLVMVVILLLAVGTRVHQIDNQSLWNDEGNSLRLAERSVSDLIEAAGNDIHPPGYYLGLKYWINIVGNSELGLRSLSVFWSLLSVAGTFALGRRLFNHQTGLLAALLIAVNPFSVYYAQEARMYAQLVAISSISLWLFVSWLESAERQLKVRKPTEIINVNKWSNLLIITNLIGLFTQYTYPFTMLVQLVVFIPWWLKNRDKRVITTYVSLNIVTLLLYVPWVWTAYRQVTTWPSTGDMTAFSDRLDRIFTIMISGQVIDSASTLIMIIVGILVVIACIPEKFNFDNLWRLSVPILLIVISVAGLLLSGSYREANLKFLLPAQVALAILMGVATTRLHSYAQFVTIPSLLFIAVTNWGYLDDVYNNPQFFRSDYRGIVETINSQDEDNAAIILNAPGQQEVFTYYYEGELPVYPLPVGNGWDFADTQRRIDDIIANNDRIYLVAWGEAGRDRNNIIEGTLNRDAFFVSHQWYSDVQLMQFAILDDFPDEPQVDVDVDFGDQLSLTGYSLSATTFQVGSGDVLAVTLYWETNGTLDKAYKVSVQLLNPDGTLAQQGQDSTLNMSAESQTDSQAIIIGDELGIGEYTLIIGVYDPDDPMQRLSPSDNLAGNNAYQLDTVMIE